MTRCGSDAVSNSVQEPPQIGLVGGIITTRPARAPEGRVRLDDTEVALINADGHGRGSVPPFYGLGAEQRFRAAIAEVTAGADPTGRWLTALGPLLQQLVDYDAAWMGRLHTASGRYLPLFKDGDVEPLCRLFADDVAAADIRQLGFVRAGWPLLGHRIQARLAQLQGFTQYLEPAGFRDGVGVGLHTGDGRHVGYLTLLTYRPDIVPVTTAALLHAVNPLLGDAVDRSQPSSGADDAQLSRDV